MAEFTGGNLDQPGAVPFPSVAQPAPAPQLSVLGKAIASTIQERRAAAESERQSSVFAEVSKASIDAVEGFFGDNETLTDQEQLTLDVFNERTSAEQAAALDNPVVKSTLSKVQRIGQARAQARSPEDLERLYLTLTDINKRFINDYPQYAEIVLEASRKSLGFDSVEKAVGLEQAEAIKQQDFERAQTKTLVDKAVSAGVVDILPDGSFDQESAKLKGQALLQQEHLLGQAKARADLITASRPDPSEVKRVKFTGYVNSVLPAVKSDIAAFGANILQNYPQLENDPQATAKIEALWGQKRAAFLANQELFIAQIDDPSVQSDARAFIQAQLAPYDSLFTGDYSAIKRNERVLKGLTQNLEIDFTKAVPIAASLKLLGDQTASGIINNKLQSDPAFYNDYVRQITEFASGNSAALTPETELQSFVKFASGQVPLANMEDKEIRSNLKNATASLNELASNPGNVSPEDLQTYGIMATQIAAIAEARDLTAQDLAKAADSLSSPSKIRLFQQHANAPTSDPERVNALASGIERVNAKNINAQAALLREEVVPASSPQFNARFGFTTPESRATPVFNPATGRVELQGTGPRPASRELQDRVRSINNSLDAIDAVSEHNPTGLNAIQTRQLIADTAGITTVGQRIELPAAQPAAPEALEQPAPRSQQEILDEFIRLGREGNLQAIQALANRAAGDVTPASLSIPKFSDEQLSEKINATAASVGVDAGLLARLVKAESGGNPSAVSSAGAKGLTQLLPSTAEELGVDPDDPDENLFGGALYLKRQIDRFGDIRKALAAYNWGPSRVAKVVKNFGDQWDQHLPKETENYINTIAPKG